MSVEEVPNPPSRFIQREFFIPGMENVEPDEVSRQWQQFRATAVTATHRKIQRLVYENNGAQHVAEVGFRASDGTVVQWIVTAIFEPAGDVRTDPWTICLLAVGAGGTVVLRDPPLLVSRSSVVEAMDFGEPIEVVSNTP